MKNRVCIIHSVRFTCVLDTNVLYLLEIRDLLFWFAYYEFYTPKWSKHIFDEWERVMKCKGLKEDEIEKKLRIAHLSFPDALVMNYNSLIQGLGLPDENDCHVLAAAIKTDVRVTNNINDFERRQSTS